jgi:hypothetical protein
MYKRTLLVEMEDCHCQDAPAHMAPRRGKCEQFQLDDGSTKNLSRDNNKRVMKGPQSAANRLVGTHVTLVNLGDTG